MNLILQHVRPLYIYLLISSLFFFHLAFQFVYVSVHSSTSHYLVPADTQTKPANQPITQITASTMEGRGDKKCHR